MQHFICPISFQSVDKSKILYRPGKGVTVSYPIQILGKEHAVTFCQKLFQDLEDKNFREQEFEKIRPLVLYKMILGQLNDLGGHILHWNCPAGNDSKNVNLKNWIDSSEAKNIALTRQQKLDAVVRLIGAVQQKDGIYVDVSDDPGKWGLVYMRGFGEFEVYLEELQKRGYLTYDATAKTVRLSFHGLEYVDGLANRSKSHSQDETYDIALSFAGEDRKYVEQVAATLRKNEVKVFYDDYETTNLWGIDLYQHLSEVYSRKSRYCIVFISEHYAKKLWTNHELKAAQERAFRESHAYILPVKLDDTQLPGIHETVGYQDGRILSPQEIARLAISKLRK